MGVIPVVARAKVNASVGGAGKLVGAFGHHPSDGHRFGERLVGGHHEVYGAVTLLDKGRIGSRETDVQIVVAQDDLVRIRGILPAFRQDARKRQVDRLVAFGPVVVDARQRQRRASGIGRNRQNLRRPVILAAPCRALRADLQRYRCRRG